MRTRWCVVILGLAGCRQILGFEDPEQSTSVTFRLSRTHCETDTAHDSITIPDPPSLDGVGVQLADGRQPSFVLDATGAIVFAAPLDQPYRISLSTPFGPFEIQSTLAELSYENLVFGRPDQRPAGVGTTVTYDALSMTNRYTVFSTGAWSSSPFFVPTSTTLGVDMHDMSAFDGGGGWLLDDHDQLHLAHWADEPTTAGQAIFIDEMRSDVVTMTDGSPMLLSGLVAPLATSVMTIRANIAKLDARLSTLPLFDGATPDWFASLKAVPVPTRRPDVGLFLEMVTGSDPIELETRLTYPSNAFPFATAASLRVSRSRSAITPVGTVTLDAALFLVDEVVPETSSYDLSSTEHQVGIAETLALEGTALDADNVVVALDLTRTATLRWTTGSEPVDLFSVRVFEIVGDQVQSLRTYVTGDRQLIVDPQMFQPEHMYVVNVVAVHGLPGAGSGDLTSATYPYDFSLVTFPPFSVVDLR